MSIFRRVTAVALAAGVVLTSAGCSKIHEFQQAFSQSTADISQWTADKMTQAFGAINAKIGADPADYVDVLINEHMLRVKAIDPRKRENVDQYAYESGSVEVKPVDVSRNGPAATEASAFKSDTVKPAVLAQTMASAPKDSAVENAKIEWATVYKTANYTPQTIPTFPSGEQPEIRIEAKGPRAEKIVHYDLTGQLLNVSQG
jgi:hypothetical protein